MGVFFALPLHAQFLPEQTLAQAPEASFSDIAAEGSNVYIVWQEMSSGRHRIRFTRSTDEGAHFEAIQTLSAEDSDAVAPRIAAAGADVYVVWEETAPGATEPDVRFLRSIDGGASWATVDNPADPSPGRASRRPAVAAVGPAVYVVWQERFTGLTVGTDHHRIYFRRSVTQGASFGDLKLLSPPASALDAAEPAVTAAGSAVYVTWQEEIAVGGLREIFLVRSLDEGSTFPDPSVNISTGSGLSDSAHPAVAAAGSLVYVTWQQTVAPSKPRAVFSLSFDRAGVFSGLINLGELPSQPALAPRVAAAGSAFSFVWQEGAPEGRIRLRSPYVRGPGSIEFNSTPKLELSSGVDTRQPAIAMAGSRLYAAWEATGPGAAPRIVLRRSVARPGLAPSNLSDTSNVNSTSTGVVAVGPDLYVVWSEEDSGGAHDILFRASFDGGRSFTQALNLSANAGHSANPRVAAAGQAVYVAWEDDTATPGAAGIVFRRSLDRGRTWNPPLGTAPLQLSVFPGVSAAAAHLPTLAAEGSEVYVAWEREESTDRCQDIFGRRSLDQGTTWDPSLDPPTAPKSLSCDRTSACEMCRAFAPGLAAAGPSVHLAFKLYLLGEITIAYCMSRDELLPGCSGATASSKFTLDEDLSLEDDGPQLSAVGSSVHVVWIREGSVRFRSGRTDGEPSWLPPLTEEAKALFSTVGSLPRLPTVASAGQEAYVAWARTGDAAQILFRRSVDGGADFEMADVVSLPRESAIGPPWLAAAGPEVFLSWDENLPPGDLAQETWLRSSTDEGADFCSAPDLSIELSAPGEALIGGIVSYEVRVRGRGCSVIGASVVVWTPIELGDVRWCRGAGCIPENAGSLLDILSLINGEEVLYTLVGVVSPLAAGTLEVTASVVPPTPLSDLEPGDNQAVVTTQIVSPAGVSLFCSAIEGVFLEGGTVTYTFVLRNGGPAPQGDNPGPEFTDSLPAGLTLIGGTADQGAVAFGVNSITWSGAIPVGGAVKIRVMAQISAGTKGTTICNQGTVFFDLNGDGINESSRLSDDPGAPGATDPCCFRVLEIHDIPALGAVGVVLLAAMMGAVGSRQLSRRSR